MPENSQAYSLRVFTNATRGKRFQRAIETIPSVQKTWQRSTHWQGGYWLGRFTISGLTPPVLKDMFRTWLGYHVEEKAKGSVTWEGMVWEMTYDDGVSRTITMETIANDVRGAFRNLLVNSGFENLTGGSPYFVGWSQNITGLDTLNRDTTQGRGASAKFTRSGGSSYLHQDVTVEEGQTYRLNVATKGDGTVAGRIRIEDRSAPADIVPVAGLSSTNSWRRHSRAFRVPTGCTTVRIYLYYPTADGDVWFDDVTLVRLIDDTDGFTLTSNTVDAISILQYGTVQAVTKVQPTKVAAQAARDNMLDLHSTPRIVYNQSQAGTPDNPILSVMVAGYIFTTKFRLIHDAWNLDEQDARDLLITELANNPYIEDRIIGECDTQVTMPNDLITQRDVINLVVSAAQSSDNRPYRFWIGPGRQARFFRMVPTPTYAIRNGRFYGHPSGSVPVNPRTLAPAIVRDADMKRTSGSNFFEDSRDFILDTVTVGPNGTTWGTTPFHQPRITRTKQR